MSSGKLIPFGYSTPNAAARLAALMQDERAILCDIRSSVASQKKPGWSGEALRQAYGKRYVWIRSLGNINYYQRGAPIQLANPATGIPRLLDGLAKGYTIILLCTCDDYETCHRRVVVELVQEHCPDVVVEQPSPFASDRIPCLSIQQPWTWLLAKGIKDIENREWSTSYRGPVLLHAGKQPAEGAFFERGTLSPVFEGKFGYEIAYMMPKHVRDYTYGAIIGIAQLVNVVTVQTLEIYNPWFCGTYGFVFEQARLFDAPIPYRGQRHLFPVPRADVAQALREYVIS